MKHEWNRFEISFYYPQSSAEVFRAWNTCKGLKSFFIETITVTSKEGKERSDQEKIETSDVYSWKWRHGYGVSGTFEKVLENQAVEFTFGPMKVEVSFRDVNCGTLLQLKQTNIPVTDEGVTMSHMNCRICWTFFLTNLKSILINGTDLRDTDPTRASSFEVGYVPQEVKEHLGF